MAKKPDSEKPISRRGLLPILGSTLLLPFLGLGQHGPANKDGKLPKEEEYETLLRPDGTTVRVKVSHLKKSKIIKKKLSNSEFKNWLDKKDRLT